MPPKAVIFDLDSTLALSKQPLGIEMGQALKRLLERLPVGIMSGADFPQFEHQLLPYLPTDCRFENLYLFPTSSAECLIFQNGKWEEVYALNFSPEEKAEIMRAFDETLKKTEVVENEPQFGERIEDRGEQITFSGLGQQAPLELKLKWDPDRKKRLALQALLIERLPNFAVSVGGTTSIDITRKGIDKAYGIHWLEKRLGFKPEEMLYVGDALFEGGNDSAAMRTGIKLQSVSGPDETLKVINSILEK